MCSHHGIHALRATVRRYFAMERRGARRLTAAQALERLQHLVDDDSGGDSEAEEEIIDKEVVIGDQAKKNSDIDEENDSSEEEAENEARWTSPSSRKRWHRVVSNFFSPTSRKTKGKAKCFTKLTWSHASRER